MVDQQRFLIVGATGSLGRGIARALREQGAATVVSGRDHGALEALSRELDAPAVVADLGEPGAADRLVARSIELLGDLDGVVNAAGVVAFGDVLDLEDAILEEIMAVDLMAAIRLTRAAARRMSTGGTIVNISAIVAEMPTAGMAAYSAAKAGLTAFDRAAARELRRQGIRLLDVRPPHTETGLADRPIAGVAPKLPVGRNPSEVIQRIVAAIGDDTLRDVSFDDSR